MMARHRLCIIALACLAPACAASPSGGLAEPASGLVTKSVSFSVLEDYDKGEALDAVAKDFEVMRELEVHTWRGSFGWDDYEPEQGVLDLEWLHRFAELAARHGITLRPYLGYTPDWAAEGRTADGETWNDPPARLEDWESFVLRLSREMRRHRNLVSYEIYNEENVPLWWDGSVAEYAEVLKRGGAAVRRGAPGVGVLPGGMVWPDENWLGELCEAGAAQPAAAFPFHAYPETWTPESVVVENYLGVDYREGFLPVVEDCGGGAVWINEMGYATTPGRTEQQQADWWARAIATFLAEPRVEHIGIYEIKDLPPESEVIGDAPNLHLGLLRVDRTPKLAFRTIDLLTDLLDTGTLTVADAELDVRVTSGEAGSLHHHLFLRPDGDQVLLIWDREKTPTVDVSVARRARGVIEYALDGTATAVKFAGGRTLSGIRLTPGVTRIFRLEAGPSPRGR
jgi:polysaccharide biosynthesis protein PslG